QHQLEEELKYRAFHDSLTGLPNRSLFAREAAGALETARAVGRTAGVLFVDLDDFKVVNDTMGHSVGDELLVAVAARLAAAVRQSDTAARLGGDEFALLIDDAADPEAVDGFAERIVAAFAEPFTLSEAKVISSATVGVATSRDSGDVDELLRHADLALYAAKAAGKRRWRHYQPVLTSGMLRRREIQAALEDAVQSSAFTLAYQPIVALGSGEIAGFESLIRWPHPRWGMMQPGQFISLAEETGLIVPLGAWVLPQALSDMVRWRHELPPRGAGHRRSRGQVRRPARLGQRVRPPVPRPGVRRQRAAGAARLRLAPVGAADRADRVDPAWRQRPGLRRPERAAGDRRQAGHRRLRHRLLVAELPARAPDRRAEGRQDVRDRDRLVLAAARPRRGHRAARPHAPGRGDRRGHRDRDRAGTARRDGLPVRPGLPAVGASRRGHGRRHARERRPAGL